MKKILGNISLAISMVIAPSCAHGFDEEAIVQIRGQIDAAIKVQYPNFEDLTPAQKTAQLSDVINAASGNVLARQWQHPDGAVWPVVYWQKVDKLKSFYDDQFGVAEDNGVVADSDQLAAEFSYSSALLSNLGSFGEPWFQDWVINLAVAADSNLKVMSYISIEQMGSESSDILDVDNGEQLTVDWNAWGNAYGQSSVLGKALILKCLTQLAIVTDEWDKIIEIHTAVFNGNNDDLKAIALVESSEELGDAIKAKWQDIAENSPNLKLKSLAQQVLDGNQNLNDVLGQ